MQKITSAKSNRGDTLVEVAFAIAIFALVSIVSINIMNAGLNAAEGALEVTMARNEMDAQAEAIRFIHNAFTLEREEVIENQQYRDLWNKLSRSSKSINSDGVTGVGNEAKNIPELSVSSCSEIYDSSSTKSIFNSNIVAFIMNSRMIDPEDKSFNEGIKDLDKIVITTKAQPDAFAEAPLYPRVLFTDKNPSPTKNSEVELSETGEYRYLSRAEGIWIIAVRDETKSRVVNSGGTAELIPEFFDYHIRTCWYGPHNNRPSTIGTIIRLYNPELVERLNDGK